MSEHTRMLFFLIIVFDDDYGLDSYPIFFMVIITVFVPPTVYVSEQTANTFSQ